MAGHVDNGRIAPYVPRLAVDWLGDEPQRRHRVIDGTAVFADISGFTALTERLAQRGKAGAEEMGDLLNQVFEQLLTAAYQYGANLIKWGGDAVLLLFDGDQHDLRACRASWEMQRVMRQIGRVQTSRGVVRLGMSIGVHSGPLDFFLVGQRHRELIVCGPGASTTAHMEKIAERGQVVISADTAQRLAPQCRGAEVADGGILLARAPEVDEAPNRTPKRTDVDIGALFCAPLREHLASEFRDHEHRVIAVGFIEFAGTDTVLAEHGPDVLADALDYLLTAAQDAAADNGVTILASDVAENGGKIIVTAGAPTATGEDENRVLGTVRRVVHPGGRLRLRGGVTCGAVFAGDYGPFYRRTYSIAGDIVNLAARLMAKAENGQVLATPTVVQRSRTAFQVSAVEPFLVKGKKDPITALLVGDQRRGESIRSRSTLPLVGRDDELDTLLRHARAAHDGRGSVVDLVAPPGMGKSRLLEELVERSGLRSLWFDGDIYTRSVPYQPMHRVLRQTLALPADVADDVLAATLRDLVTGTAPDLLPWLPLIGIAAGVTFSTTPEVEILDAQLRRARLDAVTADLLGRLLDRPTVFVINDAQFMDEATLSLVSRLATTVAARPWLIVITRRTGQAEQLELGPNAEHIVLQPLPANATETLLRAALGATPMSPHRMRQLTERAGGHPLFLTMLAAAAAGGADLDELPATVEGLIAAQIDRLEPRSRSWLRAASVLGMAFEPRWLDDVLAGTDLAGLDPTGLDEFIVAHADGRLHFAHHLIRLSAYETLPFRRRVALHASAAQILEKRMGTRREQAAALLSVHCLHGELYSDAWRYGRIAGERAREQFAFPEAADCYRRALDAAAFLPELPVLDRADVWEAVADLANALGEAEQLERALRQARRAGSADPARFARLCRKTAEQRLLDGRHANAMSWVQRGRAVLGSAPSTMAESAALAGCGARIREGKGDLRGGLRWAERAVAEAAQGTEARVLAEARGLRIVLRMHSGMAWDEQEAAETLAVYQSAGDLRALAWVENQMGMGAYYAGHWDEARGFYEQAERHYRQIGHEYGAAVFAANRAEVLVQQRHARAAAEILRAELPVLVAAETTDIIVFALKLLAEAEMALGELPSALERLGTARSLTVDKGAGAQVEAITAVTVECLTAAGDPATGLHLLDDLDRTGDPALQRAYGRALAAMGRTDEADAALRGALAAAQEMHSQIEVHECLDALLTVERGADPMQRMSWEATRSELARALGIQLDTVAETAAAPGR